MFIRIHGTTGTAMPKGSQAVTAALRFGWKGVVLTDDPLFCHAGLCDSLQIAASVSRNEFGVVREPTAPIPAVRTSVRNSPVGVQSLASAYRSASRYALARGLKLFPLSTGNAISGFRSEHQVSGGYARPFFVATDFACISGFIHR